MKPLVRNNTAAGKGVIKHDTPFGNVAKPAVKVKLAIGAWNGDSSAHFYDIQLPPLLLQR